MKKERGKKADGRAEVVRKKKESPAKVRIASKCTATKTHEKKWVERKKGGESTQTRYNCWKKENAGGKGRGKR